MGAEFVAVYSWRVSHRSHFSEAWKRERLSGNLLPGWNFRFSVEDARPANGEAVFALHTRWSSPEAWTAAVDALGAAGPESAVLILPASLRRLVLETYAVETLRLLARPRLETLQDQNAKQFAVRVLEARGLSPKNANGLSDPYVVLKMGLQRKQQTSVKSQTLEPRWNETFVFSASENQARAQTIKISVRSKDFFFRTHEIGRAALDLRFYRDFSEPVWIPLINAQGHKTKERGELLVQMIPYSAEGMHLMQAEQQRQHDQQRQIDQHQQQQPLMKPPSAKPSNECRTWRDLSSELQTGDLLFFESRGIPSKTIRWYTKSSYSHLGLVVLPKDIGESDLGNVVLVAESHPNVRDRADYRGRVSHGVQLCTVLSKLELNSYKRIAVRKLVVTRTQEMMDKLKQFFVETRDTPYTSNFVEVIKAGGTGRFGVNESHLDSMHCSGLIAEIYIRWGLLPNKIASNNYSPFDIEYMSLLNGYLTDDIMIFRSYNPITRSIDLEPARSLQTRYTMSRALRAFQDGKQYKPGKALKMLTKHQQKTKQHQQEVEAEAQRASAPVPPTQAQIAFEFDTSEGKL